MLLEIMLFGLFGALSQYVATDWLLQYGTEEFYFYWVAKFIRFCGLNHPREMDESHGEAFLSHLATQRKVPVSTHWHSLNSWEL